jgi:hypothetical protein
MKTFQITRPNGEKYFCSIKIEYVDVAIQCWDKQGCEYIVLNISDLSPQPSSCS